MKVIKTNIIGFSKRRKTQTFSSSLRCLSVLLHPIYFHLYIFFLPSHATILPILKANRNIYFFVRNIFIVIYTLWAAVVEKQKKSKVSWELLGSQLVISIWFHFIFPYFNFFYLFFFTRLFGFVACFNAFILCKCFWLEI